ncbi:MAG: tRNA lysidine(34) synthetase TilS [Lonepinella koalarum]|nr:tRNA lysidine(34) synthetase TilS [Lonepinella koalarum]
MNLQSRFATKLKHKAYLIAFSGGLDSTALLYLFAKQQKIQPHLTLRAIHIHHGLSPNADSWATHCQQICHRLGIPLIIEKVKINPQNGIEQGAREARYQAIQKYRQTEEIVATAHHLQDQTETFFLALKRGSGIQGLSAMQSESTVYNLPILRPLLEFSRAELFAYATQHQLCWIEDESNNDNRFERNFLRHEILPQLRQRWEFWDQAVARSAQHCFEQQQLINELLQPLFEQKYNKLDRTFSLTDFATYNENKQNALLRMWLTELQQTMPSQVQLQEIRNKVIFAKIDSNPQFQLNNKIIRRYQQRLYLTEKFADVKNFYQEIQLGKTLDLPDNLGTFELSKTVNFLTALWTIGKQTYQTDLPLTTQKIHIKFGYSNPVRLLGDTHHRDIKKVWQNLAVPPWQRSRIPLIFYGEKLKSAVGFFTTDE